MKSEVKKGHSDWEATDDLLSIGGNEEERTLQRTRASDSCRSDGSASANPPRRAKSSVC